MSGGSAPSGKMAGAASRPFLGFGVGQTSPAPRPGLWWGTDPGAEPHLATHELGDTGRSRELTELSLLVYKTGLAGASDGGAGPLWVGLGAGGIRQNELLATPWQRDIGAVIRSRFSLLRAENPMLDGPAESPSKQVGVHRPLLTHQHSHCPRICGWALGWGSPVPLSR